MKTAIVTTLSILTAAASLSAHIIVAPLKSEAGSVQRYELRVHNEGDIAATSFDLDIPDGVDVVDVATPKTGTFTTVKTGDRITSITWTVEVAPDKYLAFPFNAKNPATPVDVHWNVREHLADGSVVDWSDRPGAAEKGSMTTIVAP